MQSSTRTATFVVSVIPQEANLKQVHTQLYWVKGTNWEVRLPLTWQHQDFSLCIDLYVQCLSELFHSGAHNFCPQHSSTGWTTLIQRQHLFFRHPWQFFQRNLTGSSPAESQAWSVAVSVESVLLFCLYLLVLVFSGATWLTDMLGSQSRLRRISQHPKNKSAVPDKGGGGGYQVGNFSDDTEHTAWPREWILIQAFLCQPEV